MFSENEKISGRQLRRLVVLNWIGKASLLLPVFITQANSRSFFFSLILGLAGTLIYILLISWIAKHIRNDFFAYMQIRMGKPAAITVSLIYWGYMFVNAIYLVRLFAVIGKTFLLPESGEATFMVILVLAGCAGAGGGLEPRARTAEVLYKILLVPLLVMLLFAQGSVKTEYLTVQSTELSLQTLSQSLMVFAIFGGAGVALFIAPRMSRGSHAGKELTKGMLLVGCGAAASFLTAIGTFGEAGIRALPWPVLSLMSTTEIPGGFLQRWDVIFTVLLLGTFFVALSSGFYYLSHLTRELLQKPKQFLCLTLSGLAVLLAALWCEDYATAQRAYIILNGYILTPLAMAAMGLLVMIEWQGRRKKRWQKRN